MNCLVQDNQSSGNEIFKQYGSTGTAAKVRQAPFKNYSKDIFTTFME